MPPAPPEEALRPYRRPCGRSPPPRQSLNGEPTQTAPEDRRFEPLDPSELPALGAASEDAQTLFEAGSEEDLTSGRPPPQQRRKRPRDSVRSKGTPREGDRGPRKHHDVRGATERATTLERRPPPATATPPARPPLPPGARVNDKGETIVRVRRPSPPPPQAAAPRLRPQAGPSRRSSAARRLPPSEEEVAALQAKIDRTILVRPSRGPCAGREFPNFFAAADGTQRRQIVATRDGYRCNICGDQNRIPTSWPAPGSQLKKPARRRAAVSPGPAPKPKRAYTPRPEKPIPFLVKLVQLIRDEPDLIRWTREGTIVIPDPTKLESKLPSYFRTHNYSSFQRQLNNFGFNKQEPRQQAMNSVYVRVRGEQLANVDVGELLHLLPVLERSTRKK